HYDAAGRLDWVEYANGTKSDPVVRDALGRETTSLWRRVSDNAVLASDVQTLSVGGRVTESVTDGNDARPGSPNFVYDGSGRLVDSWTTVRDAAGAITSRHTAYSFATASGCATGSHLAAGKNTNRTTETVGDGVGAQVTSYCYDYADKLLSTNDASVGTINYDGHGNTTGIYGETRSYDSADRHTATVKGPTSVTYTRDGSDRLIERNATTTPGTPEVERFGFTSDSDSPDLVLDGTGAIIERQIGLPGGASVSLRNGSQAWSLPNMHGDTVVITDVAGVTAGVTTTYDPYGQSTGQPVVDNSSGSYDYGWLGEHQRGLEHQTGLAPTIEMGARQYDPNLGRFLEVDPVEGGSANDYDYVNGDPTNANDLDGHWPKCHWCSKTHRKITKSIKKWVAKKHKAFKRGWNRVRRSRAWRSARDATYMGLAAAAVGGAAISCLTYAAVICAVAAGGAAITSYGASKNMITNGRRGYYKGKWLK
ncbi:MAG: RHS repeat-associated core domain-containing protein, partial [Aquihabitans sp.]